MNLPAIPAPTDVLAGAIPFSFPHQPRGVYFLIKAGQVIYIGKTPNIYRRLGEHATKQFDAYSFIPLPPEVDDTAMGLFERRCIDAFKPPLNIMVTHREGEDLYIPRGAKTTHATRRAMARVQAGETAYAAAKKERISLSTIYNALKRHKFNSQP